jgi:predicted nucleotidyltransferase
VGQSGGGDSVDHTDQQRAIMSERELTYGEAVREAIAEEMRRNPPPDASRAHEAPRPDGCSARLTPYSSRSPDERRRGCAEHGRPRFATISRSWAMGIEELKEKREEILRVAAKHGARNVRVFGSVARGKADTQSDVDFLVDMEPGRNLLDMGGLLMDLRKLLGREIDVVTERSLKPRIRTRVLQEAVVL